MLFVLNFLSRSHKLVPLQVITLVVFALSVSVPIQSENEIRSLSVCVKAQLSALKAISDKNRFRSPSSSESKVSRRIQCLGFRDRVPVSLLEPHAAVQEEPSADNAHAQHNARIHLT